MPICRGCTKFIVWITTKEGKKIPCDTQLIPFIPMHDGKETFVTADGYVFRGSRVIEGSNMKVKLNGRIPHWATCSEAEKFKPKARAPQPSPQSDLFGTRNNDLERGLGK